MSAELDALTLKVQRYLTDFLNDVRVRGNAFDVPYQSTLVTVTPYQQESGRLIVSLVAYVCDNVPITPALYEWVAEHADDYILGHVGLFKRDNGTAYVRFRYSLLGATLDYDELKEALWAVAISADELDDIVHDQFGGERWVDPAAPVPPAAAPPPGTPLPPPPPPAP